MLTHIIVVSVVIWLHVLLLQVMVGAVSLLLRPLSLRPCGSSSSVMRASRSAAAALAMTTACLLSSCSYATASASSTGGLPPLFHSPLVTPEQVRRLNEKAVLAVRVGRACVHPAVSILFTAAWGIGSLWCLVWCCWLACVCVCRCGACLWGRVLAFASWTRRGT